MVSSNNGILTAAQPYDDLQQGSPEERRVFESLQERLVVQFRDIFPDPSRERCIVVVPSLSVDTDLLLRITGFHHYEERMLFMLMLLRLPRTRLIYVTSQPIDPLIIDYYLHLLSGIPTSHARERLTLLSCHDSSSRPLAEKVLERPLLLERIRTAVGDQMVAHLTVFNATRLELTLSVKLGIPLYACDPILTDLGSKSGSREIFAEADVDMPPGFENLRDEVDITDALTALRVEHPYLKKAVVKMNEGFGGEGNAVFSYAGAPSGTGLGAWITAELPNRLQFEATDETWENYSHKFSEMSGVVEGWISGEPKRSPSVQCLVDPLGEVNLVSTHDQSLGGPSSQIYEGCTFPADEEYSHAIQQSAYRIAEILCLRGVKGRFGVDFVSIRESGLWKHYAIEINLRKGGTTHPFLMLQYLTHGVYDHERLRYYTPTGQERYYRSSDDLRKEVLKGLTPHDLIDLAVFNRLHFDAATQQGVVFHLLGAMSEFGKIGILCIGDSHDEARHLFDRTIDTLESREG
ncbi:MAG: peptide ligase PGM1-related protein [Rhodothermia bacterium]